MTKLDANSFSLTSDLPLLANYGAVEQRLTIPAGTSFPAMYWWSLIKAVDIEPETAQMIVSKIFSSKDPDNILVYPGVDNWFDRGQYLLRVRIDIQSTQITFCVGVANTTSSAIKSGASEDIVFQVRPLGRFF